MQEIGYKEGNLQVSRDLLSSRPFATLIPGSRIGSRRWSPKWSYCNLWLRSGHKKCVGSMSNCHKVNVNNELSSVQQQSKEGRCQCDRELEEDVRSL